jgi:hypothetical protein
LDPFCKLKQKNSTQMKDHDQNINWMISTFVVCFFYRTMKEKTEN